MALSDNSLVHCSGRLADLFIFYRYNGPMWCKVDTERWGTDQANSFTHPAKIHTNMYATN